MKNAGNVFSARLQRLNFTAFKTPIRRTLTFVLFLVLLALIYEGYRWFGEAINDNPRPRGQYKQRDWWFIGSFMPRHDDLNMPPILSILSEFDEPLREGGKTLGKLVWDGAIFSLRSTFAGFVAGVVLGMGIAMSLLYSKKAERGVMPYVIISQTIPLIAIAPIIVIWGRTNFDFLPWEWQPWMSVSIIATYLSFFPVAVNGLRGLQSANPVQTELMQSYGASKRELLWKLYLPSSLPYLFPAFRLAAISSVVGVIVAEISAGVRGGLGRLILDFAGKYSTGPERLYGSIIGAAILGLFAVGVVALAEKITLGARGQTAQ